MQRSSLIAATTVIAIALVALQVWNRQRPTEPVPPPLARNLPKDVPAADREFKARVRLRFPPGSPDAAVVRELAAEGFHLEAGRGAWRSASLKRAVYPCNVIWRVRWRTNAGKVAETGAEYGLKCP